MESQRTVRRQVSCAGIGLHSGQTVTLTLGPAPAGSGIRFLRTDLGGVEIAARVDRVTSVHYATVLAENGHTVETVEHVLAALVSLGIDNVVVGLDHAEVPIMDGSAAAFVDLIHEAGVRPQPAPRRCLRITRPVELAREGKQIALYPSDRFRISYSISFDHPLLRHQERTITVDETTFVAQIAPARTFTFLKEIEQLRQNGYAVGGSLENAVVVGDEGILNHPLRFEDEFVRHKMLDAIGDLALVGMPIVGHLVVHRGGHDLHTALAWKVFEDRDAWEIVEQPDAPDPPESADSPVGAEVSTGR
jgi:UDP-3-O-[3-hydroxymyristoyl] N-acetylglucosamine deacetylase